MGEIFSIGFLNVYKILTFNPFQGALQFFLSNNCRRTQNTVFENKAPSKYSGRAGADPGRSGLGIGPGAAAPDAGDPEEREPAARLRTQGREALYEVVYNNMMETL